MADYRAAARRAAQRHGLDPGVFLRQIKQESGFNPSARSPAGAIGIAQIMPATAKSWGVDPTDPIAALDAAAKNMASYVKQFGSYKDALVAYNAGPGRVGKALPAETQNYIKTILGGSTPSAKLGPALGSATTTTQSLKFSPGQAVNVAAALSGIGKSQQPQRPQVSVPALPSILTPKGYQPVVQTTAPSEDSNDSDLSQQLEQILKSTQNTEIPTAKTTTTSAAGEPGSSGEPAVKGSQIKELFWQGPGGINIKNGQLEPQGFVPGHQDHVHVAAGPKTVVELGRVAQGMGLHVGENPHFGGVNPVHVQDSYHYKNEAIDVSGDTKKMAAFARYVKRYSQSR